MSAAAKIPVAILGATGVVGQKLVSLLSRHPWFSVTAVAASDRSAGRSYADAVNWLETTPIPPELASLEVESPRPGLEGTVAFAALDAATAKAAEPEFASAGYTVVTNASPLRLEADIPLLIPEINADQLSLLATQRERRKWTGGVVTNPNCSAVMLAIALAPLDRAFGIDRVVVSTMQALSGAGYPGVAALDAMGNVIPFIANEEEKIERETQKILGTEFALSVHANRVPVADGHMASVSVALDQRATPEDAIDVLRTFRPPSDVQQLPSAPCPTIGVLDGADRPQPRLDATAGNGMRVSIGRVRSCPTFDLRFTVLAHNTIRGAAGAALLNAELLVARGIVSRP